MNFLTNKDNIFVTIKKLACCPELQAISEEIHIIGLNIIHLIRKIVTSKRLKYEDSFLDKSVLKPYFKSELIPLPL